MEHLLKEVETLSDADLLQLMTSIGELLHQRHQGEPPSEEDCAHLPFFGMYADQEDMEESVAWVRRERERWNERLTRTPP